MRFYGLQVGKPLSEEKPSSNVLLDPKCSWAPQYLEQFPAEVNWADYYTLLRVLGMGVKPAKRTVAVRRSAVLGFPDLKKTGVVLERAMYFIICNGRMMQPVEIDQDYITSHLVGEEKRHVWDIGDRDSYRQLSLPNDMRLTVAPMVQDARAAAIGDL